MWLWGKVLELTGKYKWRLGGEGGEGGEAGNSFS